jgi:thiol:disulfide interchange protein
VPVDPGLAPAPVEPARSSIAGEPEPAVNTAPVAPEPRHVAWERSEPDGRARARREARPLLVYLRADWATDSLWMEREIWSDPRVVLATMPFVAVVIDVTSAEGDAELYAQRYGVEALPTVVLFDGDGRRVASLSGAQRTEALIEAMRSASE